MQFAIVKQKAHSDEEIDEGMLRWRTPRQLSDIYAAFRAIVDDLRFEEVTVTEWVTRFNAQNPRLTRAKCLARTQSSLRKVWALWYKRVILLNTLHQPATTGVHYQNLPGSSS